MEESYSDCMFKSTSLRKSSEPHGPVHEREREGGRGGEREREGGGCMFDDRIRSTGKVILIACQVHTNLFFAVIIP